MQFRGPGTSYVQDQAIRTVHGKRPDGSQGRNQVVEYQMIFAGIDAGSRILKIVLIDENRTVLNSGFLDQGIDQASLARGLLEKMLKETGKGEVSGIVATGYGRDGLDFADTTVTEITCHARGVYHLHPGARTVIDIGGQDSKVIRMEEAGKVRDFVMNDRCAAGTGRFLEVVAERLEMDIGELGLYAEKADRPSAISSTCVVFAETEIIGLLVAGERRENIVAGVQRAIASRIVSMTGRLITTPVFFTGGVALIPGMGRVIQNFVGCPVSIAQSPLFTGALGAALLAAEREINIQH